MEIINWCRDRQGEDEEIDFFFEVAERSDNRIAITIIHGAAQTTLVVDWKTGRATIERRSMHYRQALRIWSEVIAEALDGKLEKAQHRGYFHCRICNETVYLAAAVDILNHLNEHDLGVEQVQVGEGIQVKVGDKTCDLDSFLVGEEASIH
ncbi:MAG: hypothetical protein HYY13_02050 [Nitrospirae bacterium]|nr:hypothetical protein [Nitrospirota bacterium]